MIQSERAARHRVSSWAARYGQAILRDGIATVPMALFTYQAALGLTAQEVWFTAAVLSHKWDEELPRPSLKRMAEQTGVRLVELRRFRARLCERQLLQVEEQHSENGAQRPNAYDFGPLFRELEELLQAEPANDNNIQDDEELGEEAVEPRAEETDDTSFIARYGRVVAGAGVAAIPQGLFTHQAALGLTPQQAWFICYILAHRWTAAHPHPSLMRMHTRTGYGVRYLHYLKDQLIKLGYLRLVPRYGAGGRRASNGYDFSALLDTITGLLTTPLSPPAPEPSLVVAARLPRALRRTGLGAEKQAPAEPLDDHPRDHQVHRGGDLGVHRGGDLGVHVEGIGRATRGRSSGAYKEDPYKEDPYKEDDSNRTDQAKKTDDWNDIQSSPATAVRGKGPPRRGIPLDKEAGNPSREEGAAPSVGGAAIAGRAEDYSRELGDTTHTKANVSQTLRLWQKCGFEEDTFVALMHEARDRLRLYQGKTGESGIANKTAYYFRVLEELTAPEQRAKPAPPNVSRPGTGGRSRAKAESPPAGNLDPDKYLRGKYAHLFNRAHDAGEESEVGDGGSIPRVANVSSQTQSEPSKRASERGRARQPPGSKSEHLKAEEPALIAAEGGTQRQAEPAEQADGPSLAGVLSAYGGNWPLVQPIAERVCAAYGWSPAELAVALTALPRASLSARLEALWAQKKAVKAGGQE